MTPIDDVASRAADLRHGAIALQAEVDVVIGRAQAVWQDGGRRGPRDRAFLDRSSLSTGCWPSQSPWSTARAPSDSGKECAPSSPLA